MNREVGPQLIEIVSRYYGRTMETLSPKSQAMSLIKLASESGAGAQAMEILQDDSCKSDMDSTVNWPLAVIKLQKLINGLSIEDRRGIIVAFDEG